MRLTLLALTVLLAGEASAQKIAKTNASYRNGKKDLDLYFMEQIDTNVWTCSEGFSYIRFVVDEKGAHGQHESFATRKETECQERDKHVLGVVKRMGPWTAAVDEASKPMVQKVEMGFYFDRRDRKVKYELHFPKPKTPYIPTGERTAGENDRSATPPPPEPPPEPVELEFAVETVDEPVDPRVERGTENAMDFPQVAAEFPGGQKAMYDWMKAQIRYPSTAIKDSVEGKTFVQFVVSSEGRVTDVVILRGIREDLDQEALRVISSMPKWKPAEQKDQKVAHRFRIPIIFKLPDTAGTDAGTNVLESNELKVAHIMCDCAKKSFQEPIDTNSNAQLEAEKQLMECAAPQLFELGLSKDGPELDRMKIAMMMEKLCPDVADKVIAPRLDPAKGK